MLNLVPTPPDLPQRLIAFYEGLTASIYFMPFLKIVETVCGGLLLVGWFVPLVLVILAPVVLNIFLVHLFLAPSGLPLALVMGLLMIYLSFFAPDYAPSVKQLFKRK